MVTTFEAETNETFFDAGSIINYRLYLVQNISAPPVNLSSIVIVLRFENLEPQNQTEYSVNISNTLSNTGNIKRLNNGSVQLTINKVMGPSDYMEIKFNARVPALLGPLTLLQVAFTMNATTTASVMYGPKYSNEIYTTFPEINLARTPKGGKS